MLSSPPDRPEHIDRIVGDPAAKAKAPNPGQEEEKV